MRKRFWRVAYLSMDVLEKNGKHQYDRYLTL
jgi:hypothetical protein